MNFYLDTEFNGFDQDKGELISLALVTPENKEFYVRLPDPPVIDPWVEVNVMPRIGLPVTPLDMAKEQMAAFLRRFDDVDIFADYPTDLLHFLQMLLKRPDAASRVPPMTLHLVDGLSCLPVIPHHALSDAYALMEAHLKQTKVASNVPASLD